MKFIVKILGMFLVFSREGWGSEFTQDKFEGLGRDFINSEVQRKYKEIVGRNLSYLPEEVKEFRLEKGVDVKITIKGLKLIDKLNGHIPPKLEGLTLSPVYQSYQIVDDDKEMLSLRQIYGRKCPEKFFNPDRDALTMAIVYSISSISIKEKTEQITITSTAIRASNRLLIENILLNHRSELVIRYLTPENTDGAYALFIVNSNKHSLQHESENLVAEFTSRKIL